MNWYEKLEEYELEFQEKYDQYGAEGILEHIFNGETPNINPTHKYCVELGAMDGVTGSTTKWLADECGWEQLGIEGNPRWANKNPNHVIEKITAENVNELLKKYKVPTNLDFLSLDIDSNDYWVLKSLLESNIYRPKVFMLEYNPYFEIDEFKAITYNTNYSKTRTNYYGASISAYKKLSEDNGYKLAHIVHCHNIKDEKMGRNAFFIKSEYLPEDFEYDTSHIVKWLEGYKSLDTSKDHIWVDVS
jgi:hypothetical protein